MSWLGVITMDIGRFTGLICGAELYNPWSILWIAGLCVRARFQQNRENRQMPDLGRFDKFEQKKGA